MTEKALRLGTRRSKLAMAQSGQVADAVSQVTGRPVELVEITTYGDVSREHLAQIGGTGVFVAALREALARGEVDFAVHSLKDLPTAQPDELVLAAIPEREDPRDVIIARDALKLTDLPRGARIGTGSPRRMAQLNAYARAHGMDIETVPIRGNVDTRIGYVTKGDLDAVVLAAAGLNRIGRSDEVTDFLSVDTVLPAPARGTGDRVHRGRRGPRRRARRTRRPVHAGRRDGRALPARRSGGRLQRTRGGRWPISWTTGGLSRKCACGASSAPPTVPRWCSCPPPVPCPRRTRRRRRSAANSPPRCSRRARPV